MFRLTKRDMTCERCEEKLTASVMSMFNTQVICMECKRKEKAHPKYQEACKAECDAVQNKDLNFPGIGLPNDL